MPTPTCTPADPCDAHDPCPAHAAQARAHLATQRRAAFTCAHCGAVVRGSVTFACHLGTHTNYSDDQDLMF